MNVFLKPDANIQQGHPRQSFDGLFCLSAYCFMKKRDFSMSAMDGTDTICGLMPLSATGKRSWGACEPIVEYSFSTFSVYISIPNLVQDASTMSEF